MILIDRQSDKVSYFEALLIQIQIINQAIKNKEKKHSLKTGQ